MTQRFIRKAGACLSWLALPLGLFAAATDGSVRLEVTLLDYNGSGTKHWTVVWVTTEGGQFIKTLRKQGPSSFTTSHWNSHCSAWVTARGGLSANTAFDGYSSATANDYSGTNSPVIIYWDCRDGSNNLVADGAYKFWVQYAEDSGQGPYTTSGLLWVKGTAPATNTYPDQTGNFTNMKVTWIPAAPPTQAPSITSAPPPGNGTVGVPYRYQCQATGTPAPVFEALNLPPGLSITPAGLIAGIPARAGTYSGTITASNGVAPSATQPFAITIGVVPVNIQALQLSGPNLVLEASGPPGGQCRLLSASQLSAAAGGWVLVQTNAFDAQGQLRWNAPVNPSQPSQFFRIQIP
ncbi:MAG: Ig domain-containing protein [Verrucomicrobiae bacterium]|nr:Ig domain-containing protein [Verrucomicrobiae bacterium]